MAHSAWMIPNSADKISASKNTDTKASSGAQNRIKASFAAVMAKEQNAAQDKTGGNAQNTAQARAATTGARSRPMVARLPETGGMPLNNTVLAGRTPGDMMRMQVFNQAQSDLGKTRAMDGFLQGNGNASSSLGLARSMVAANSLRTLAAANNGAGFALTSNDFIHTSRNVVRSDKARRRTPRNIEEMGIGKLSARFESGGDGIAAIGYDRNGGTSYGKYQIASRVGSMASFLSFLDAEAPDLAKRLRRSGPSNTGSRNGAMPTEWRAIAKEQPERFEQLQEAFIHQSHYKPALEAIQQRTGLEMDSLSAAMREVIWSTAVQHGPAGAARIFAQADSMSGKAHDASYERKLITNVYNLRAGQFGSSTNQVREAVRSRFRQERELALGMLQGVGRTNMA